MFCQVQRQLVTSGKVQNNYHSSATPGCFRFGSLWKAESLAPFPSWPEIVPGCLWPYSSVCASNFSTIDPEARTYDSDDEEFYCETPFAICRRKNNVTQGKREKGKKKDNSKDKKKKKAKKEPLPFPKKINDVEGWKRCRKFCKKNIKPICKWLTAGAAGGLVFKLATLGLAALG